MSALSGKRAGVALGMAVGLALTIAAFLSPRLPEVPDDINSRLSLWLACAVVVAFWLLVSVGRLAAHRFFSPFDIDGGGLVEDSAQARHLQALLQNTLEQAVLAIVAYGAWLWLAPFALRGLVIIFAVYFAVGRLLFFTGYAYGAPFRALGFTLTFYPTAGMLLALIPMAASRIFE